MDFLSEQLIRLRRDINSLRKSIDASRDQKERHHQENHTERSTTQQVPLWIGGEIHATTKETHTAESDKRTRDNRNFWMQVVVAVGTWGAVLAAAIYAGLTWGMWNTAQQSLTDAQRSSKDQLSQLSNQISELETANQIAIATNRPWVGTIPPQKGVTFELKKDASGQIAYVEFTYFWSIKNAGHRPARLEGVSQAGHTYTTTCGMHPDFEKPIPNTVLMGLDTRKHPSTGLLLPDGIIDAPYIRPVDIGEWDRVMSRQLLWCIYLQVNYRDVDYPKTLHHTWDCRVFYPNMKPFQVGTCNNEYAHAD